MCSYADRIALHDLTLHFLKLFITSLLIVAILSVSAQRPGGGDPPAIGKVSGRVLDINMNIPIEYATVALFSKRDSTLETGGITDGKGRFNVSEIKPGRYYALIRSLGYEELVVEDIRLSPRAGGVEKDLGDIVLAPAISDLKEVEVTGEKPLVINKIDRRIFNAERSTVSEGGSANDLLGQVPSVEVDIDGAVSLRGSKNLTVLIDGKPSTLTGSERQAFLEGIPASSIESIEVITNPSAKYDPEGTAGIINIILKKNKLRGFTGNSSASIGTNNKYNASLMLNYRNEQWSLTTSYSFRDDDRWRESISERRTFNGDTTTSLDQNSLRQDNSLSHLLRIGLDHYLTNKITLSANALYNSSARKRDGSIEYSETDEFSFLDQYERFTIEDRPTESFDLGVSYLQKFRKEDQELRFDLQTSKSNSTPSGDYMTLYTPSSTNNFDQVQRTNTDKQASVSTIQLDYAHPIKNDARIEAGYKTILRKYDDDFYSASGMDPSEDLVNDTGLTNHFVYKETVHAIYGIYGQKIKRFGYQLGVRLEQAFTRSELLTTEQVFRNDYFSVFPSGHISYDLREKDMVQISYTRRIDRPSSRSLNPFPSQTDPLNIRIGNPTLTPEYTNSMELNYSTRWKKGSLTAGVYFKSTEDMISRYKVITDSGVAITSYQNFASGSNSGAEIVLTTKPYPWWDITASANVFRSIVNGENIEADLNQDALGWYGKLMNNWKPFEGNEIQLSIRYRSPRDIAQGSFEGIFNMDIAVKQSVLKKKGSISLRVSDIFDTRQFEINTVGDNWQQYGLYNRESRILYITFSYRFGKLEQGRGRRSGSNNSGNGAGGDDMMGM